MDQRLGWYQEDRYVPGDGARRIEKGIEGTETRYE